MTEYREEEHIMKKIVLMLSIAIMVLGSSIATFAQPSAEVNSVVDVGSAYGKDGRKLDIIIEKLTGEQQALVDDILKPENLKNLLGDAYSDKFQVIDTASVYVLDENGNKIDYKDAKGLFPVNITFNVPGVKTGDNVVVLHYYDNKWHVADVEVGDGKVAGVFDKLSPFVFMVERDTVKSGDPNSGSNSGSTPTITSPETGDSNVAMYIAIVAVAAFAGVVVSRKKKTA